MKRRSYLFLIPLLLISMCTLLSCAEECIETRVECMDGCPTEEEWQECMQDCGPFPGVGATDEEIEAHAACAAKCKKPSDCEDECNKAFLECEKDK